MVGVFAFAASSRTSVLASRTSDRTISCTLRIMSCNTSERDRSADAINYPGAFILIVTAECPSNQKDDGCGGQQCWPWTILDQRLDVRHHSVDVVFPDVARGGA